MKPQDLEWPFSEGKQHVLLQDRILHIPFETTETLSFSFPGWDHASIFGNQNPIKIEYCSGNGTWIAAKALQQPDVNWVAVEKKFSRIRRIWSKIKNHALSNLLGIHGEAFQVSVLYFPTETVSEFFINFPDPWPKRKHAQHRLVQPSFLQEVNRILIPGGTITLVTDDTQYSNLAIKAFLAAPGFESLHENPYYVTDVPDYGSSFFEELWRLKGRTIRYHQFFKKT